MTADMPQTLEETREALFRLEEQMAGLRRRLVQHEVINAALRAILSDEGGDGSTTALFARVFTTLRDMLHFDEAMVLTGNGGCALSCEAATEAGHVGLLVAPGPSAARALRGRVVATTVDNVLSPLPDAAGDSEGGPPPRSPALCAPFSFMGLPGFLMFLRAPDRAPFDRADMDLARHVAVLAAQTLAMKAAERAAHSRSRFLAGMSHELRTPLNGIIGSAALLDRAPLDAREQALVESIRRSGQSLLRVIGGILDYSQLEAGLAPLSPAAFDLHGSCAACVAQHAESAKAKGLALAFDSDAAGLGPVLGDAARLADVLGHLLDNAIRFTPEGRVTVRLRQRTEGRRALIEIAVEDTGPGIAPPDRQTIFEPFRQGGTMLGPRPAGSGLGLAVCRLTLRELGSTLSLRAAPDGGSVFSFALSLPLAEPVRPAARPLAGLEVALITADDPTAERLDGALSALGAHIHRFGAVPPLPHVLDRLHGESVIIVDAPLLPRARASWLMQTTNPGLLNKLPWLVLCGGEALGCGPASTDLPRLPALASGGSLVEPVRSAVRALP